MMLRDIAALGECKAHITLPSIALKVISSSKKEDIASLGKPLFLSAGGVSLHTLLHLKRLGFKTSFVSMLADDFIGSYLFCAIKDEKIDITHLKKSKLYSQNLVTFVLPEQSAEQTYAVKGSSPQLLNMAKKDLLILSKFINSHKIFYFSASSLAYLSSMSNLIFVLSKIDRSKTKIAFLPDFNPELWNPIELRKTIAEFLHHVDYIFPIYTDEQKIYGQSSEMCVVKRYMENSIVVMKTPDGSVAYRNKRCIKLHSPSQANASSDHASFVSGCLKGLLENGDVKKLALCANVGSALGSRFCDAEMKKFSKMKQYSSSFKELDC